MRKKQTAHAIARAAVQVVFFLFLPQLFSAAFGAIRSLADHIHGREVITWNPFLTLLCILLAFTILFGRFFCGYACAFGSLGDWLYAAATFLRKKAGRPPRKLPDRAIAGLLYVKHLVLFAIVVACLTGLYASAAAMDPWSLFGALRAGQFSLAGKTGAALFLALIFALMCLVERGFCMFLCPMGAAFELLPMLPLTVFGRKKEACLKGCSLCVKTCPASIALGEPHAKTGDCFQCGKCSVRCPKENIRPGLRALKGTELWWTAARAAALFALCAKVMGI